MQSSRQFEMLYILLREGRTSARQLAGRLGVSVRTIYRDVEAMCVAGVPVCCASGPRGGIWLMEGYVLDRSLFSREEQRQMLFAMQGLNAMEPEQQGVLEKLRALFPQEQRDWLQMDFARWGDDGEERQKFQQIRRALMKKRVLSFEYCSAGSQMQRRVYPARLAFKAHSWYLQGYCLLREDFRTFKLGRMRELRVLDEQFELPRDPPALEMEPDDLAREQAVLLRFPPWMAGRVQDEFYAQDVHTLSDGSLLAVLRFAPGPWLTGYLLSFTGDVEVLYPPHVRRALARTAMKIFTDAVIADMPCQQNAAIIKANAQKEEENMSEKFCQSCGMPMQGARYGQNADGTLSEEYCEYCYQDGAFTSEVSMEQMMEVCVPFMVQGGMEEAQARELMRQSLPHLKRWKR